MLIASASPNKASCIQWDEVTRSVQAGDSTQFQILFDHFFQFVFREVRRLSGRDEASSLDIVQETMLKIIRHIKPINNEPQLTAWIRAVARTTTYDWLRKDMKRRQTASLSGDIPDTTRKSEMVDDQARLIWIEEKLEDLPPETRKMIHLKYRLGWSLKQIGQTFGLKTGAVDGRIRRAVQQLRKNAEQEQHDLS